MNTTPEPSSAFARSDRRSLRFLCAAVLAVSVSLVTACGGGESTDGSPKADGPAKNTEVDLSDVDWVDKTDQTDVVIQGRDNSFTPAYIIVKVGTPITFRNLGRTNHNALPVDGKSFKPIEALDFEPKDEETISFGAPGDYPFYCSLHGTKTKGMVGAVRVVA